MPTQNRMTLKGYFTKGSIPTEDNFADLIDSTLNQQDDGLLTSATAPLSIKAVGADEGLINFYRIESGQNTSTWQIKHLPVGSGPPGLSIGTPEASPYTNETTRLFIDNTTGNVGIGTTTPGIPLTIGNDTAGDKISFYGQSGDHYGIGVGGSQLQIHTSGASGAVVFGYGNSGTFDAMHETMRIQGDGRVGIGTKTPGFPLTIGDNTVGDKISLFGHFEAGRSEDHYGFGIQTHQLQIHTDGASADVVFGYGNSGSSSSMTETMRIKGNGNVGIGTDSPADKLHIVGGHFIQTVQGIPKDGHWPDIVRPMLDRLPNNSVLVDGPWSSGANTSFLYIFWKDQFGTKFVSDIQGARWN